MFNILAQAATDIAIGGGGAAGGAVVLWILQRLLSFKRVHAEIDLGGNGNGKSAESQPQPQGLCPAHPPMMALMQSLADGQKSLAAGQTQLTTEVHDIHIKIDRLGDTGIGGVTHVG
jgi:hypothetical protein